MIRNFFEYLKLHVPIHSPLLFGGATLLIVGYVLYIALARRRSAEGHEPEL
jgi:hypothetical protein